ncbi:hypothetical protein BOX15_Mlig007679g1 [Macrostomum lignano]|uniref:Uncharacterized protein n=1 Tax=Macrostomum lignano TaxID=282301 RepID=A0A267DVD7_9PLAT|nr:hypothetical protein BOX15_Mlig007679g1 [Macrostomum lignano]
MKLLSHVIAGGHWKSQCWIVTRAHQPLKKWGKGAGVHLLSLTSPTPPVLTAPTWRQARKERERVCMRVYRSQTARSHPGKSNTQASQEMSKKHLEHALQAGHRISAGQPHHQPRGPVRLEAGPSIAGSPEDEGLFALCYVDGDRRLVLGTGSEGIRCLAADFAAGGEAAVLAEAVTVKQNQPFGGLAVACVRGIRSHPDVILAAATSGYVYKADWSSPGFSTVVTERGNHLSAVDTSDEHLATVGSDCSVRVYDLRTCQPVRQYSGYRDLDPDCPEGHATRLFAARFNADGLLLTSGWDDCVKFWDLRLASGDPVRRLSGPHICCPDGLDVKGDRVLTGSYRAGSALQLWDARQCEAPSPAGQPTTSTAPGSPPNPPWPRPALSAAA